MGIRFVAAGTVAALSLAAASGCSASSPSQGPEIGASQSAVQGGTNDAKDTFAVGVSIGGKGQSRAATCSGALIAPNLVVTARHCVDQTANAAVDCATDKFGALMYSKSSFWVTTASTMDQQTLGWHQVIDIFTPPATAFCGNDIALLLLSGNVPASEATPITPAVQYPITDHSRYSTTVTAIGYGVTAANDSQGSTAGTRRIREQINMTCIPGDKSMNCGTGSALTNLGITEKEFISGDSTCEGDSGSSAYEQVSYTNGAPVSFGVLSRGGTAADGITCIEPIYTRLDSWADFIVTNAKAAAVTGGYPAPAWTYPAGVTPPPAPVDAGTDTGSGGSSSGGTPTAGEVGAACSVDDDCASQLCRNLSGSPFVCSQGCDTSTPCPTGFSCSSQFCFAKPSSGGAVTTTTTSGCSVALGASLGAASDGPNKPNPWRWLGLGALVAFAALRRRRVGVAVS